MCTKVGPRLTLACVCDAVYGRCHLHTIGSFIARDIQATVQLGYPFFEVLSSYGCTQAPGFVEPSTFMETLRVGGQAWAVKTRRRNVSYCCITGYFPVESTGQTF